FEERYRDFRRRLGAALVGEELAGKYDFEKLALLYEKGKLVAFLEQQGQGAMLGGWLGAMAPRFGTRAVTDHNLWPYFARRFGLRLIGFLEPKPGVPPTTRHLGELIKRMKAQDVPLILASAYYDPRHADFVARSTGARVVGMANQTGAREGTDEYLKMIDYDVRQIVSALEARS
ncbi:MAG: metal ABC transporter substrate-binding protein, partial [Candidatus Binatia bacterium]